MNVVVALAAAGVGAGCGGVLRLVHPPTPRLASRVRPYAIVARAALGVSVADAPVPTPTTPLRDAVARCGRAIEARSDERLALLLRQSGTRDVTPGEYRARQVLAACAMGALAGVAVAVLLHNPMFVLVAAAAGFFAGVARTRGRLERAIAQRAERARLELTTVNQLLAIHVRTGAGALQAVQRVVDRGHGVVVDELGDVLTWTRSGMSEVEAFRRAAELTAEPGAARTYRLLAAGAERGVDLGAGLLALSADLRDARREQLHKNAVRRRAAMLLPTIALLAPIMLLFIAAPLPSIVLGHR
jgi:Flp pilus assembly protein TadB